MIPIILPSGLNKEIKNNLKNGHYSQEQVQEIFTQVQNDNATKRIGFKRASIAMVIVGVLMTVLSISQMMKNSIFVFIMLGTLLTMALVLVAVRFFYIDKIKRQFLKYVKLGGYKLNQ